MILGQIYFYNKILDTFQFPVTSENVANLQLLGLDKLDKSEFQDLSPADIQLKIKDLFTKEVNQIFLENSLNFCASFWQDLTSPLKTSNFSFTAKSTFQENLQIWQKKQYNLNFLLQILELDTQLKLDDDFILYYCLKVLARLGDVSPKTFSASTLNLTQILENTDFEASEKPQILVFTKNYLSPLFLNLGCEILESTNLETLLVQIQTTIKTNPEIKLVILDNSEAEISKVQKYFPSLVVASLNLGQTSKSDFFDNIVKSTLGIRLN